MTDPTGQYEILDTGGRRGGSSRAPSDRAPSDRAPSDRAPSDRAPADRAPADRAPADRAAADRALSDRALSDRAPADRDAADRERPDRGRSGRDRSGRDRSGRGRSGRRRASAEGSATRDASGREQGLEDRGIDWYEWPAQDLPSVDLGTSPGEGVSTGDDWTTWWRQYPHLLLLGAFVAGAVLGATVWDASRDADARAVAEAQVRLAPVLSGLEPVTTDDGRAMDVALHNLGDVDISVLSLHPDGWSGTVSRDITVPAGRWAEITMTTEPRCRGPLPTSLVARVQSGSRVLLARMPLPPGENLLLVAREDACGSLRWDIGIDDVRIVERSDTAVLMNVALAGGPTRSVVIEDLTAAVRGFRAETEGVPTTVRGGDATSHSLAVTWGVTSCEDARNVTAAYVTVRGDDRFASLSLGEPATAALAQLALTACDGS